MKLKLNLINRKNTLIFQLSVSDANQIVFSGSYEMLVHFDTTLFIKDWLWQWHSSRQDFNNRVDLGRLLKKTLIPPKLEAILQLYANRSAILTIQDDTHKIPWEAIQLNTSQPLFLGETFLISRNFSNLGKQPLAQPRSMVILLAEDPNETWTREAYTLKSLAGQHNIACFIHTPSSPKNLKPENISCEVLHFIGHNTPDHGQSNFSAMSLSLADVLYTYQIEHLSPFLQANPLVFLNTCHSGMSESNQLGIRTWPHAFLQAGASAVLGPWTAIENGDAMQTAEAFYEKWFSGLSLPQAFHAVKRSLRHQALAYCLYDHSTTSNLRTGCDSGGFASQCLVQIATQNRSVWD